MRCTSRLFEFPSTAVKSARTILTGKANRRSPEEGGAPRNAGLIDALQECDPAGRVRAPAGVQGLNGKAARALQMKRCRIMGCFRHVKHTGHELYVKGSVNRKV